MDQRTPDTNHYEIDVITGMSTTGHQWDGIKELNTPLPRWWVLTFYATILWSVGYWIVYPAWPLLNTYTVGLLGYSSRAAVTLELVNADSAKAVLNARIASASFDDILRDKDLSSFAIAQGRAAFSNNCAPCHGSGAAGAKGYPNLNDDDWLWGGKPADIYTTLLHGVRWNDAETRVSQMPAFGRDGILAKDDIENVAGFVRSLSGLKPEGRPNLKAGAETFASTCAACHGDTGAGNRELGAPNLRDAIWLYGSSTATIVETLTNGRNGVMPGWKGRLDDTTIKALTIFVHSLGGGEK